MKSIKEQLILHEGLKLKPYLDTVGKITIGVGRNISDRGITKTLAMEWLDEDINLCMSDLETFPWFFDLDSVRKKVLIDMRFNLGPSRFRGFKNTLKAVAEGRYADAADGMLESRWAAQVGKRAVRLANMMRDGVDYEN